MVTVLFHGVVFLRPLDWPRPRWRQVARKQPIEIGADQSHLSLLSGVSRNTCGVALKRLQTCGVVRRVNRGHRTRGSAELERTLVRLPSLGVSLKRVSAELDRERAGRPLTLRGQAPQMEERTRWLPRTRDEDHSSFQRDNERSELFSLLSSPKGDTDKLPGCPVTTCLGLLWVPAWVSDGPPDWHETAPWDLFTHPLWRSTNAPRLDLAAARVWVALVRGGANTVAGLQRATGFSDSALSQAREGKAPPILHRLEAVGLATAHGTERQSAA